MTNDIADLTDDWVESDEDLDIIDLSPEIFEQASTISQAFNNESRRWTIYEQAIALFAFEEWLKQREPSLIFDTKNVSVLQPQYANVLDVVCCLKVGEFLVVLIPGSSFWELETVIPRSVVDLPEFVAHFYIVIGIVEELEVAAIRGFIRYDQLLSFRAELQTELDWNYSLPLTYFTHDTDELLLYLQGLTPIAIPLPTTPTNRRDDLVRMQAELLNLLPRLYDRPLWQVLTWEQGIAVFTTPDLLNWLYYSLDNNTAKNTTHLSDLFQILTQSAVNVRNWLDQQVDEALQLLSWEFLPALSSIREQEATPERELESILTDIQQRYHLETPAYAVRVYQNILTKIQLRIYAINWLNLNKEKPWKLLLIIKKVVTSQDFSVLKLRVSDKTGILAEETLQSDSEFDYVFIQVEGEYEDKFLATITSETGEFYTLPPFEFSQEF